MKSKIDITGVSETMLQTLYARAKETNSQNAKIKDDIAVHIVENIDYDFSKADKDSAMSNGVIARTIVLDRMVEQYLNVHTNAVVVNIACGLDTRCYRMKGKYLRWYNLDLPQTMKIREQFLTETGPMYQIAKSAMDDSYIHDIESYIDFLNKRNITAFESISVLDIEDFLDFYALDHSAASVNRMIASIHSFHLQISIAHPEIKDVSLLIHGMKSSKHLPVYLSVDEVKKVFSSFQDNEIDQYNKTILVD